MRVTASLPFVRPALALCGLLAVTGCNTLNFGSFSTEPPKAAVVAAPTSGSPVIDFVATGVPGQQGMISDPAMGPVSVSIDRLYTSASGHNCRRYTVVLPGMGNEAQTRYTCEKAGHWIAAGAAAR